jgi:hypothetical protein
METQCQSCKGRPSHGNSCGCYVKFGIAQAVPRLPQPVNTRTTYVVSTREIRANEHDGQTSPNHHSDMLNLSRDSQSVVDSKRWGLIMGLPFAAM